MRYRVAQYHLAVEAESPDEALEVARTELPDVFWTGPRAGELRAHMDDPVLDHARWLLEEWAIRGGPADQDLIEESKITAQLMLRMASEPEESETP